MTLHKAIHFRAPPRPMPLAMPHLPPLRCRRCSEPLEFPDGRDRWCRCERRNVVFLGALVFVVVVLMGAAVFAALRGAP